MQKRNFTAGGFSPDRGKREEMACAVQANPAEPGRWGGRTRRQNGAVRWTAGQSGRTGRRTRRQNRAAGRSGRTERQDGAAGRGGRTERQDGAAGRGGRTGRQDGAGEEGGAGGGGGRGGQGGGGGGGGGRGGQKKRGGEATSSQRTGPGAPPAQTKKRDSNRRKPPDSEKAHGEAARHLQKANAQVLNTLFGHREGCNIIRTAAVSKITESNFSIFLHSDHSFQAHSRTRPWSFPFPELCPEAERVSVSANLRRHRAAFDLRFSILCTISHKILFYDVFTGFSRHAPTHVYGAARIHGAAPQ